MSINTSLATVEGHPEKHPHSHHQFTGTSVLLGADGAGNAAEVDYAEAATATTVPVRDANGDVIVPTTPTAAAGAASKDYVDAQVAGARDPKDDARVATTAALPAVTAAGSKVGKTLTADAVGVLTIDGVATVLNDRILVKDQAAGADNGLYKVTTEGTAGVAFVLTRAADADEDADVSAGLYVWVSEGAANGDKGFLLTTNDPITVDTTALTFSRVSGLGQVTAGAALTKTGDTLDWAPDDVTLEVSGDQGRIKALGVGTAELAADAVTAAKIAAGAVGTTELAADAVTSAKIAADAVTASEIAAGAVGTSELAADSVTAAEIAAGAVGTSEIAADAVTASEIAAGAVGTSELAADAVTIAKLADQKAKVTLAGTSPVLADMTGLTADGHYAIGIGTDNSAWHMWAVDAGGLKKFAVGLSEITA